MSNNQNQKTNFSLDAETALTQEIIKDFYQMLYNQVDINQREDGYTILIHLAWVGRIDLVKQAISLGADVNAVSDDNTFALCEAARRGWEEVYEYLAPLTFPRLRKIAKQQLKDGIILRRRKNNYIVEEFIQEVGYGNIDFIKEKISQGINVNAIDSKGRTALNQAIINNKVAIVQILIQAGANPNLKTENSKGYSSLMISLSRRKIDYEIFKILLNSGGDINETSSEGQTVLMFAVSTLNLESGLKAVKQLLKLGVDVNAKDTSGRNALYYAKEMQKNILPKYKEPLEMVQLLLNAGAIED